MPAGTPSFGEQRGLLPFSGLGSPLAPRQELDLIAMAPTAIRRTLAGLIVVSVSALLGCAGLTGVHIAAGSSGCQRGRLQLHHRGW
jgi:alkylhydroperoxidase/carboxymuconolactone decarboxylase family protein YurZ